MMECVIASSDWPRKNVWVETVTIVTFAGSLIWIVPAASRRAVIGARLAGSVSTAWAGDDSVTSRTTLI